MASISAMSNNTSLMYQIAAKGLSADSSSVNYATLLTQNTQKTDANDTWAALSMNGSTHSNSSASLYGSTSSSTFISSLTENKTALNDVMSSYNVASKNFDAEYGSIMSDLKNSAKTMATTNFNVTGATDKDTESNVSIALKNVNSFVNDYNDAVSLFSDYSNLSDRLNNLSSLFSDNSARSKGLAAIGIDTDATTGKLSVNTEKLTAAMKKSPSNVEYQLGDYGLAGKTQSKIDIANSQKSQLFPSITEMAGDAYNTSQALYSGNAIAAMNRYSAMGNFMDMYF